MQEDKIDEKLKLSSGHYITKVYEHEINDMYDEETFGGSDYKYYKFVERVGLIGWIPMVLFIISLFTSYGRNNWGYFLLMSITSLTPYLLLSMSSRYRITETLIHKHNKEFPNFIIVLEFIGAEKFISGGRLDL